MYAHTLYFRIKYIIIYDQKVFEYKQPMALYCLRKTIKLNKMYEIIKYIENIENLQLSQAAHVSVYK